MARCAKPFLPVARPVLHLGSLGHRRHIAAQLQVRKVLLAHGPHAQVKGLAIVSELADDVLAGGNAVIGIQPVQHAQPVVGHTIGRIQHGAVLDQLDHFAPGPVHTRHIHIQGLQHITVHIHHTGKEFYGHAVSAAGLEGAQARAVHGIRQILGLGIRVPVLGNICQQHIGQGEIRIGIHDAVRRVAVAHQSIQGSVICSHIFVHGVDLDIGIQFHKSVRQILDGLILIEVEIGQLDILGGQIRSRMVSNAVDHYLFGPAAAAAALAVSGIAGLSAAAALIAASGHTGHHGGGKQ